MPSSLNGVVEFLETQWSSINANKVRGIEAELAFKQFLRARAVQSVPGGWIMTPGNNSLINVPPRSKIGLLPRVQPFSWAGGGPLQQPTLAEISTFSYFQQVGIRPFFVTPVGVDARTESTFRRPLPSSGSQRAQYFRDYQLEFSTVTAGGLQTVAMAQVFASFPRRRGNIGLRCYDVGRINVRTPPWNSIDEMTRLFWFEYAKYFAQVEFLVSNNDLDLFVIGASGSCYPVELKAKQPVPDPAFGPWFGIDMGPFAKLSFFTANSMNTDALYVVQELDAQRMHVDWLGIRFTELVKSCSWVGQGGGTNMMGGASATYKVPKAAFTSMANLLPAI